MHIGLIGGLGPAATCAYYQRLIAAFKAADLPLELTIAHADMATLVANASVGDAAAQAQVFARHVDQLQAAGCDMATITALTGHFCFAETQAACDLPLLDATALVDDHCRAQGYGKIGLLGSPSVLETHLFGTLSSVETCVPPDTSAAGGLYMQLASTGRCSDGMRAQIFDTGARMIEVHGADAVLLAGTDLGLAYDGQAPGYAVIDALDVHVAGIVAQAVG